VENSSEFGTEMRSDSNYFIVAILLHVHLVNSMLNYYQALDLLFNRLHCVITSFIVVEYKQIVLLFNASVGKQKKTVALGCYSFNFKTNSKQMRARTWAIMNLFASRTPLRHKLINLTILNDSSLLEMTKTFQEILKRILYN